MRALVVLNPAAGQGRARRVWRQARAGLNGQAFDLAMTERPGHARDLARQAAADGYERVVSVGGDGTASEVAGGLAATDTALAIVPAGTGNDYGSGLGVPANPVAAARLALTGPVRSVDLGALVGADGQTRPFLNVAGFGFDAVVVHHLRSSGRVGGGGTIPYVLSVLRTLRSFRPVPLGLTLDGQRTVERIVFVAAVANGRRYAGGMRIAPEAHPGDGLFDVCLIGDVGPLEVLRILPTMYWAGHRHHPKVEFFRCRELQAIPCGPEPVSCQADGDPAGALPATFAIQPGSLRCVTGRPA